MYLRQPFLRYIGSIGHPDQIIAIIADLDIPSEQFLATLLPPEFVNTIRRQVVALRSQRGIVLPASVPGQSEYQAMVARLQYHLPMASPAAMEFLGQIFVFDQADRMSVTDLLEHPFFQELPHRAPVRAAARADTQYEENHTTAEWRQLAFNELTDYVAHQ